MPSDTTSLFIEHRRSLVDYAAGILGSRAQAEDVVQEAYIRFSAANGRVSAEQSPPIVNPLAYLYAIVRNLALTWARRSTVETVVSPASEEIASAVSDTPSIETVLVHRDELRTLAAALVELPERTRMAFNMHRLEGRPLREVADRLGISITRAQQLVKAAMVHGARRLRDRT
ncbi:sigma-70 family RNA polymerase sigma factor [Reyranella sp.]|uniref:sigma-70 family RNA polymerase sigma factor n=1 Tax=Reyranella sp. TaxID=1929291 RepID=UPI003BAA7CF7